MDGVGTIILSSLDIFRFCRDESYISRKYEEIMSQENLAVVEFTGNIGGSISCIHRRNIKGEYPYFYLSLDAPADKIFVEKILKHNVVFVVDGGNTYEIAFFLRINGWMDIIRDAVLNKGCHYIGYSAGAIIATSDIDTAQWADGRPSYITDEYLEGIGLVDFIIKPHADYYMKRCKKQFKRYALEKQKDFYCIYNEGWVIVEGDKIFKLLSPVISPI